MKIGDFVTLTVEGRKRTGQVVVATLPCGGKNLHFGETCEGALDLLICTPGPGYKYYRRVPGEVTPKTGVK